MSLKDTVDGINEAAWDRAMRKPIKAHSHAFDLNEKYPTSVTCTVCGFTCPAILLKSRTSMDAYTMRKHATDRVLELLGIDREHGELSVAGER